MNKYLKITTLSALMLQLSIVKAFAVENTLELPDTITDFFSITSLGEFIGAILSIMFIIAGIIVFIQLVVGGLQWILSGGDKGATQAARDRMIAAIVGLAIIALSYAIVRIIEEFFGIAIIGDLESFPLPYDNF